MATKKGTNKTTKAVTVSRQPTLQRVSVEALAAIPEEELRRALMQHQALTEIV
jgi:hypothetical protein